MKTEKDDDSTFRTGAAFVAVGFILIAAIWYLFLRPQQEQFQPPAVVPLDTAVADATIYELIPGESRVQFSINELLRGQPKTVVGITQLVSGQIALNPADLSTARVGVIQANALSFYTDDAFRDEALHTFIIDSPTYPLVTFTPTRIEGLPAQIAVGETAVFTLTGSLTIRDITQPVTFDCTAVLASPTRLEGHATAAVSRANFNLRIPEVTQVANVSDEFLIEIDFVATAVGEN